MVKKPVIAGAMVLALAAAGWWLMRPAIMAHDGGGAASRGLPRAMTSTFMAGIADGEAIVDPVLPALLSDTATMGKRAFEAKCISCHGENAAGVKGAAPPLVHKIYEPSHHGDFAFVLAVKQGVRAHHWPFGNMPPVPGLTQADAMAIATYVRELQVANGIR